eukprot:TRINITY_DN7287_c0_g1_i11.p1 TRINITY_DN7287_c0_g1~~TRINITY_DN7287_c0_g1_i11.p1  ORF type:complete len:319 (-),score=42.85 TRINITY_DN7287_c0_g1_i11:433-1389(-)
MNFLSSDTKRAEKIRLINLSGNTIGDEEAAESIGKFLSHPSCKLKHLDISDCHLTDNSAMHIFHALRVNTSLNEILIQDNFLTDESLKSLSTGLLSNPLTQVTQVFLDNELSENILYTDQGISYMKTLLAQKPEFIVKLHNDFIPLSSASFSHAEAFNNFGKERMRRVGASRQKKRDLEQKEKSMEKTLVFFHAIIHICQIHHRSNATLHTPTKSIQAAFQYQAYGVTLPEIFLTVNKYLRAAESHNVVVLHRSNENQLYYALTPIAQRWTPPIPPEATLNMPKDEITKVWQHMMTGLVCNLRMCWCQTVPPPSFGEV